MPGGTTGKHRRANLTPDRFTSLEHKHLPPTTEVMTWARTAADASSLYYGRSGSSAIHVNGIETFIVIFHFNSSTITMNIHFFKYQGTGNDFVIMDNRSNEYDFLTTKQINFLCDRRFGIGADGLMLLNLKAGYDFEMKYYNSDGNESSMCGNGGRCLVKFAHHCGIHKSTYSFSAIDGDHEAEINGDVVSLKMKDVDTIEDYHGDSILDTGSPHYVKIMSEVNELDVFEKGREIRYSNHFAAKGINVNFVEQLDEDEILVRTYERGVEAETLSCGTGVTASALVSYHNESGFNSVVVTTKGGKLSVEYDRINKGSYHNIWLSGPAEKVYEGTILLEILVEA